MHTEMPFKMAKITDTALAWQLAINQQFLYTQAKNKVFLFQQLSKKRVWKNNLKKTKKKQYIEMPVLYQEQIQSIKEKTYPIWSGRKKRKSDKKYSFNNDEHP